ncbi:hypothetical protein RHGRI_011726 [Rhododendron griersonianum]|uniref:Uncharacterized protein n=1 Tax=Rhododendron griersonianum TaxID=479676 RepID=A0AAV6KNU8_9ERIC|nr:hypothetical protein RHGRI_011726 [Rhododendron griersonianum]
MDSLLCDEIWLTENSKSDSRARNVNGCFYTTKEDCREAFEICLQKELSYMPESGYRDHLQSSGLSLARFRVMLWLAKGWKYWMFEVLAIACLSVASKFGETAHPPFHEIQDDIIKCHKILEGKLAYPLLLHNSMDRRRYCICPPSPVTVLKREQVEACGCKGDHLSLFKIPNLKSSNMKRKREVDHDQCDEIGTEL